MKTEKEIREEELELGFNMKLPLCAKCGKNEVYQNIYTMDWCEPCIWEFVKDDSNN